MQQPSGGAMADNGAVQDELTLRQIVDGISALVAVLTPDGAVEIVNRQVQDDFGKTLEEMKEWSSSDAVHPDDLPGVIAQWTRSIESGQPYNIELRQRGADGVYRWFHRKVCLCGTRKTASSVGSSSKRMSMSAKRQRRRRGVREECLNEAQHLSRPAALVATSLPEKCSGQTRPFESWIRPSHETCSGGDPRKCVIRRIRPGFRSKSFVQPGRGRIATWNIACYCPTIRSSMSTSWLMHRKMNCGLEFVGAVMDVTAAKEAEERIRRDERELATTIETIPALVLSFLPDGTVDFVSHRWLDYVGLSREEMFPTRKPLSPTLGGAWKSATIPTTSTER